MKDWLTPSDVAILTGFSVSFIRTEIRAGVLPAVLVRSPSRARQIGRYRITRENALAYVMRLGISATISTISTISTNENPPV